MFTILYIDDEADLLEIAQMYLEETGIFRVDTAISAGEAQKKMAGKKYDAVIADYQMPVMDGITFLKYTRKSHGDIPFILFTGKGREEVAIEAINNGADYYLQKGGDPDSLFAELIHKLQHAIRLRRDQETIRVNEERLRKAQILGHTGAWEYNIATETIWGSDEALRIFGIAAPAGEVPVEELEACIPDRIRVHQALMDLLGEGKEYNLEYTIYPADSSGQKIIRSVAEMEKDREGNPLKIVGIIQDITAQNRMESALQESEKKYRSLVENSLVGVGVSAGTQILYANRTLLRMYGYDSLEEITRYSILELVTSPSREMITGLMRQREEGIPLPEKIELDIIRKDGARRTLEFTVTATDYDGRKCDLLTFIDITERGKAVEMLRRSEERFRDIYENAPIGIFHSTPGGRLLRANPALAKMLGYPSADALIDHVNQSSIGEELWEDPRLRPAFIIKVLGSGTWNAGEHRFRHRDGQILTAMLSYRSIVNPDSGQTELEGFIEDITERKKAETALKESESGYRNIIEQAVIGIFRTSPSGIFLAVNPAFARFAGYASPEEMIASVNDIRNQLYVNPADRTRFIEGLSLDGFIQNFEAQYYHKDRRILWTSINARVVRNGTGDILYYEGTVEDITRRKSMEEALKKSEATFRSLVDLLQDSVIIVSFTGEVLFANPSAFRLVSMAPDQMKTGTSIFSFIDPDSRDKVQENLKIVAEEGSTRTWVFKINTTAGTPRWVEASGTQISYLDGNAILVTIRDITERKESLDELAAMTRKLHLISSITRHDILNKITVILGHIQVARKKHPDPDSLAFLEKLESSTKAIREQIEFARIYESLGSHAPQWQSLSDILSHFALPPAIRFEDETAAVQVYADPMLEKVFYNLIDNSIRYGETVSVIRLRCRNHQERLTILYEDDGVGIQPEDKERIFDRGYGKNTGLGLFLSREILTLTGISIRECGVPGRGARFELTVPGEHYRLVPGPDDQNQTGISAVNPE
jgi:PAS domain S-box-containing protein